MLPDLLLIDGGKGQLHMAMEVMQELGLEAFMVGVSKGEGRKPALKLYTLPMELKFSCLKIIKHCI